MMKWIQNSVRSPDLDKEEGNQQDIRDLKDRKRKLHAKRKIAARDGPVEAKKKKGKGKGKGKGKKKGGGKNKGKKGHDRGGGKTPFMHAFARKRARVAHQAQEEEALPKEEAMEVDEPANQSKPPDEVADEEGPLPSSSSKGPGSAQAADHEEGPLPSSSSKGPEHVQPKAEARGGDEGKGGIKKAHKSPEEILGQLSPPGCFIGIDYNAWRFQSNFKVKPAVNEALLPPYNKNTMSQTFHKVRSWEAALEQVHKFNWEKYQLIKHEVPPLPTGEVAQTPGKIPDQLLEALRPVIQKMEEPKNYAKK